MALYNPISRYVNEKEKQSTITAQSSGDNYLKSTTKASTRPNFSFWKMILPSKYSMIVLENEALFSIFPVISTSKPMKMAKTEFRVPMRSLLLHI